MGAVQDDLSRAYAVVFIVAVVLVALTFIPAAFLPRKPASPPPNEVAATPAGTNAGTSNARRGVATEPWPTEHRE
jgi:hypothetical protein